MTFINTRKSSNIKSLIFNRKQGLKKLYIKTANNTLKYMSVEETVICHYRRQGFNHGNTTFHLKSCYYKIKIFKTTFRYTKWRSNIQKFMHFNVLAYHLQSNNTIDISEPLSDATIRLGYTILFHDKTNSNWRMPYEFSKSKFNGYC